ncbi:MAG: glutaredoxin [Oligoflexia bacterium]|nr:glutaredoxin [Oligoflexia bacterium]
MDTNLNFINEEGTVIKHELTVYMLSTCGFCKKALRFLRENSIKFRYIYFDELERELRDNIIAELTGQFKKRMSFPFVVIDNKRCLTGFDKEEWENEFL